VVKICGGEMIVPAGEKVSDEQVAAAMPDVIVLAWAATGEKSDPAQTYKVAAWKDVPAIRNRRVHVIRDEYLNTPGPPLIRGALKLFQALHWFSRHFKKEDSAHFEAQGKETPSSWRVAEKKEIKGKEKT
jgi:ABC-type Fe3+-hydroxamate transport system substrate-binding protein